MSKKSMKSQGKSKTNQLGSVSTLRLNQSVSDTSRARVLKHIHRHQRTDEKILSAIIHQPIIEVLSQSAEKTIARPLSLLGGGLFAFGGSAAYLWMAKYYGYDYNYLLPVFLFVVGFVVGMFVELIVRTIRRK